ncbi:MAG: hypothetical protein ABI779_12015 [Acidobacteriota bacterium]
MTASQAPELPKLLSRMIARRARGEEGKDTIAVARRTLDQLAVVLVPLISQAGFDALLARALQLTQREHLVDQERGGDAEATPSETVRLWLERLPERQTLDAATALLSALAALLTTLIGESLTTRYLRKAWPDGFGDAAAEGTA